MDRWSRVVLMRTANCGQRIQRIAASESEVLPGGATQFQIALRDYNFVGATYSGMVRLSRAGAKAEEAIPVTAGRVPAMKSCQSHNQRNEADEILSMPRDFRARCALPVLPSTETGDDAVSFDAHQGRLAIWSR